MGRATAQGRDRVPRIHLPYRPPYDWAAMLSYLRARAIEGVEQVDGAAYRRRVRMHGRIGTVEVVHRPERRGLVATLRLPGARKPAGLVARLRHMFDLDADVAAIGAHLARDPWLAPLVASRPGLRVPGGWDGFEVGVRAILGQQVSVEAGRRLVGRLVRVCGTARSPDAGEPLLAFPEADRVARADLTRLGVPRARQRALGAVAQAALTDASLFQPQPLAPLDEVVARLCAIPGIGEWTAQYIALRAVRAGDAFPARDVGLLRSIAARAGARPGTDELRERAERWRPWRAYAAQHLWAADAASRAARG